MTPDELEAVRDRAREVAEDLVGTCRALYEFATQEEQDSPEFCEELDNYVLECQRCNWWWRIEDIADTDGDAVCTECHEEQDGL